MARVPQYQQQVDVQNEPRVREQNVGSAEVFGAGVGRALGQATNVVGQIVQREQDKADIAALMAADRELADLELSLFHDPDNGAYAKRGRDAFGTPDQVFPAWDKTVSGIEGRLTPAQRLAFQKQAQGRRQSLETGLARHITTESDRFYAQEADATVATSAAAAAANYNDPARVALEAERATRAAMSLDDGAPPEAIKVRIMEAQSSVYAAAVERRLQDDPVGAIAYFEEVMDKLSPGQLSRMEPVIREARKTQVVFAAADAALSGGNVALTSDFAGAVEQVLATEGGYVADDAGKGETNFGINTTANPGVDIKGLSEDQAREIYKTKYWDAIDADSLPPELRGMAFDAAVNQGVGKAKEMLRESGGDPAKFLALRREHYESLIDANPEKYAQYAEGWEKRVAQFEQGGMGAPPATLSQALRSPAITSLPADERKQAELRVRQEWQAVELAEREASDARLNDGFAFIQGGGTVAGMPPALRAAMKPKEIADLEQYERVRRSNGGGVETDLTRYGELLDLAVSQPLKFASMSLVADQKNLSESDYKRLLATQSAVKAGRPDALLAERKLVNDVATPVLRELGILRAVKGAPTRSQAVKGQEKRYEAFTAAVQSEVSSYRQRFGKDPSVDDVQGIVDRLVISQTVERPGDVFGSFWTDKETRFAFEADKPPSNQALRVPDRIYSTPRGPMRWTGTGWTPVEAAP